MGGMGTGRNYVDRKRCLKCDKLFPSLGKFNRICPKCFKENLGECGRPGRGKWWRRPRHEPQQ